jgi:hypothetical protein
MGQARITAWGASLAEIDVVLRHLLADDADIVQVRLDAVVRAATDGDLEFVRQGDLAKALIEALVDFSRESLRIDVAKHADRALAGHDRTNFRSPVPPVTIFPLATWARNAGMSAYEMPGNSTVNRDVNEMLSLPNFSAASHRFLN